MASDDSYGDAKTPAIPLNLPPEAALLLPNEEMRDIAPLAYRLFSDDEFRRDFWNDPAAAMLRVGIAAQPRNVLALQKLDQSVFEILVRDWKEVSMRTQAFKWSAESGPARIAVEALVMAAVLSAAMVGSHLAAHYVLHHLKRTRDRDL